MNDKHCVLFEIMLLLIKISVMAQNEKLIYNIDGKEAGYIVYFWNEKGNIQAISTKTHEEFKGHGVGKHLFQQLLNLADEKGVKIHPVCPFVISMFQKHPDLDTYLEDGYVLPCP